MKTMECVDASSTKKPATKKAPANAVGVHISTKMVKTTALMIGAGVVVSDRLKAVEAEPAVRSAHKFLCTSDAFSIEKNMEIFGGYKSRREK